MTDDFVSDLEQIEAAIPKAPVDLPSLRALLGTLPPPVQPSMLAARSGYLGGAVGSPASLEGDSLTLAADQGVGTVPSSVIGDSITAQRLIDTDIRVWRTAVKRITSDDNDGVSPAGPIQWRHIGAFFQQGPSDMDLDVVYAGGRPVSAERKDNGVVISDTAINYAGPNIASIVVTRFGRTITVTPTYTGSDITHIDRVVT